MENKKEKEENIENISPEPLTTKVYYFVDDQTMPYSTEIPVPPSKITLDDFKRFITRRSYKCYCKVMDSALNAEVKAEIRDDFELLKPNANGRFELFLLSENVVSHPQQNQNPYGMPPMPLLPPPAHAHHFQTTQNRAVRASMMTKRASTHYVPDPKMAYLDQGSSPEENNHHLFGDSNFASSISDGDSQYTTTDFTSVSQQKPHEYAGRYTMDRAPPKQQHPHTTRHNHNAHATTATNKRYDNNNKPYWTREKRKRYRPPPPSSFLSSTFEDTEISMAVDLITVTFNMDTRLPFGMSVVIKKNRNFQGIVVYQVAPNSLVALDGRIKPGYILLEINGIPLDEYENTEDAIKVLSDAVREAVETRGQLKLTCARGEVPRPVQNIFRPPPAEPVRPIDPTAWVEHTNAERGLNIAGLECSAAFFMNIQKSATLPKPKTNPQIKSAANIATATGKDQSTSPLTPSRFVQRCAATGLKMIQNPSTEITTTTTGHSSLECSIGQEIGVASRGAGGDGNGNKKGTGWGGGGRIGSALRRLVCIGNAFKRGNSRKRRAEQRQGSAKKK